MEPAPSAPTARPADETADASAAGVRPADASPAAASPAAASPDAAALDAAAPDSGGADSGGPDSGAVSNDAGEAAEEPAAPVRLGRGEGRSPRDMAMSLAVLLVPIALFMIFYRTVLSGDAPATVDPAPTIQKAQQAAAFTVAVPRGLNDDWHTSTATFKREDGGATLRIGYVDPDDDPIQLVESSVPTDTVLRNELTSAAKPTGTFRAANGVWRLYDGRPGEQALVLADTTRTIVIVGRTDPKNLESLAGSLP